MNLDSRKEIPSWTTKQQWEFPFTYSIWEEVGRIIEPIDTGFSCPWCWNPIETEYCQDCACFVSPNWELLAREWDLIEILADDEMKPNARKTKKVIYKSDLFEILKARTSRGKDVSIDINYKGSIYRLIFGIWEARTKKIFSMIWKRFKYKYLPNDEYWKIQNIVKDISSSPQKYGLSNLKAFKK